MRFVASILLLASLLIHLLLGAGYVLASKYQQIKAETEAGDLSSVAGDLNVSKDELDRMHTTAQAQTRGAGRRELFSGIGLLASALAQLLGGVLLLIRRGRALVLVLIVLALGGLLAVMLLDHFMRLGVITAVLLLGALGSAALARGRAPRPTTT